MATENFFGKQLRTARQEAGKTLKQVAEALNVSAMYVSAVERGRKAPPDAAKIAKLAEYLGLQPSLVQAWADMQHGFVRLPIGQSKQADEAAVLLATMWHDIGDTRAADIMALLRKPASRRTAKQKRAVLSEIFGDCSNWTDSESRLR